jgi:hypothetical protein
MGFQRYWQKLGYSTLMKGAFKLAGFATEKGHQGRDYDIKLRY